MVERAGQPKKYLEVSKKVSFAFILIFLMDILFLGNGAVSAALPVSSRIVWFFLALVSSIPLLIHVRKKLIRNPFLIAVCGYLLWIAINAVRGVLAGNNRAILVQDVKGFLNYCLLPTMLCVLATNVRRETLMKATIWFCAILAVATVAVSYYGFFPNQPAAYNFFESNGLASISWLKGKVHRVFLHTASRMYLVAFMFLIYFLVKETDKRKKLGMAGLMALMIVAIFISYTRAIYGGCFVAVVVIALLLIGYKLVNGKALLAYLMAAVLVAVAILGVIGITQNENLFQVSVQRLLLATEIQPPPDSTGDPTTDSTAPSQSETEPGLNNMGDELNNLNEREEKLRQLNESIRKNPIFGNGLGAAIDFGYVEYTYQDVVNKMGIVGLALFLLPFLLQVVDVASVKKMKLVNPQEGILRVLSVGIMVYFLMIAYFNPCMNTTSGIFCYMWTMVTFSPAEQA